MVNISKLSNEELYTIIDSMPIDFLKLILKKESKNSSHLFHGFRVKNLSEERIHRKLKTNLKDVFVQHIIVTFLRNIYNEVRLQKNNYLKLENGEYEAFFKSIVKVIVPQMYEIYFKALEVPYTSETISALKLYENLHKNCERLETDIKTAQQNNEQLSKNNVELKAHITKLEKGNIVSAESLNTMRTELKKSTETIFELQTSIETSNREYQSIIESKDSEIDYLNNVISEKQRKFKAIETTNGELLTELTELKNSISNSENCTPSYIKLGYHISEDNVLVEEYTSNSELLNFLLADTLKDMGVESNFALPVSAFIHSAHMQKIPLMLVGIGAKDIINAYSVCVYGKTATEFDCTCEYSAETLNSLTAYDSGIIIVKNFLNSKWMERIDDMLKANSHIVFVSPFAEDLTIQPKSLWNYIVPILTEVIVDKNSGSIFIVGKYNPKVLQEFKLKEDMRIRKKFTSNLNRATGANRMLSRNLSSIFLGVYQLLKCSYSDVEILLAYVPYWFITQNTPKLKGLDGFQTLSKDKVEQLCDFLGVDYAELL